MQDKPKKSTTKNTPTDDESPAKDTNDTVGKIVDNITKVDNILVALSKNPSVDELAGALGLTLFLDGMDKHATAIFSGKTPNALEFLKPEETFETNTNSLQDFIIALNKEKADHLRYKLDGDYVKVFITPYKTTLSEDDLDFSHGDFNVNLVIALNVPTIDDLDGALYEHGRIMHDATAINITTGVPGRFGEIEWSDPGASSISEMLVQLTHTMRNHAGPLSKEVATAFLTGIVANTERFSNDKTTPTTMSIASRLMEAGANQTLVSENVMKSGVAPTPGKIDATEAVAKGDSADLGTMTLHHDGGAKKPSPSQSEAAPKDNSKAKKPETPPDPSVLQLTKNKNDGKKVDNSPKNVKTTTPNNKPKAPNSPTPAPPAAPSIAPPLTTPSQASEETNLPDDTSLDDLKKDITAAINSGKNPAAMMAPEITEPSTPSADVPTLSYPQDGKEAPGVAPPSTGEATSLGQTPAQSGAAAQSNPMPLPTDTELPPPPAPPINLDPTTIGAVEYPPATSQTDTSTASSANVTSPSLPPVQLNPATPSSTPTGTTLTLQPPTLTNEPAPEGTSALPPAQPAPSTDPQSTTSSASQSADSSPQSNDPAAFKIPGMG